MPGAPMATSAVTSKPLSRRSAAFPSGVNPPPATPRCRMSSAPNRSAWRPARRESSAPPIPSGNPKKFSIRDVYDACPPGTSRSTMSVDSPSEAAYTAAARPAGPGPRRAGAHDPEVVVGVPRVLDRAPRVDDLRDRRVREHQLLVDQHG